jgi:hypothetical protein
MRERVPSLNVPGCTLLGLALLAELAGLFWKDRNAIWATGAAVLLALVSLGIMLAPRRRR